MAQSSLHQELDRRTAPRGTVLLWSVERRHCKRGSAAAGWGRSLGSIWPRNRLKRSRESCCTPWQFFTATLQHFYGTFITADDTTDMLYTGCQVVSPSATDNSCGLKIG